MLEMPWPVTERELDLDPYGDGKGHSSPDAKGVPCALALSLTRW